MADPQASFCSRLTPVLTGLLAGLWLLVAPSTQGHAQSGNVSAPIATTQPVAPRQEPAPGGDQVPEAQVSEAQVSEDQVSEDQVSEDQAPDLPIARLDASGTAEQTPEPLVTEVPAVQAPVFQAKALGALDPWGIGWGGRAEGQLPNTLWRGSDARVLAPLFEKVATQSLSPAAKRLAQRVALASGSPPTGDKDSLILARIALLQALGAEDEAFELLAMFPTIDPDHDALWAKAEGLLQAGQMRDACALLVDAEDPVRANWIKIGAFCRLLEEDTAGADLMVELARAQGIEDPWFFTAVGQTTGSLGGNKLPGRLSSGLETAVSLAANLSFSPGALDGLSGPVLARLARNDSLPLPIRLEAAERALLSGDAEWTLLADLVAILAEDAKAGSSGTSSQPAGAPDAPLVTPILAGSKLALMVRAYQEAQSPLEQSAVLAVLLSDPQTADPRAILFADWLKALTPSSSLAMFAPSFTRAAIAAGDTALAARWRAGQEFEGARLPDPRTIAVNNALIVFVGLDTDPGAIAMISKRLIDTARGVADRQVNARLFSLYSALGLRLPPEARLVVATDLGTGGKRVRPGLMVAVRAADDSGSLGELVMTVLAAIEDAPERLEVSDLSELIAALNQAGLVEEARLLAREAALGYTRR